MLNAKKSRKIEMKNTPLNVTKTRIPTIEREQERQKYEKSLKTEMTKKTKCVDELNRIGGEIEKLEMALNAAQSDLDGHILMIAPNGRK